MMKWTFAIQAALGGVLVLPAVIEGQDAPGAQASLDRTIDGLERLAGLSERLKSGDPTALADVRRATEASADPRADEMRLAALRREVSRLQMVKDEVIADPPEAPVAAAHVAPAPNSQSVALDAPHAFEAAGYSADVLRQGVACLRAGRDAQALSLFTRAGDDAQASYWKGRAFEKLERFDEAAAAYTHASSAKDGGWFAERARAELEFLAWKRKRTP
jgi:hypothetical protein